jgi:fatty acid-binding protein DegV
VVASYCEEVLKTYSNPDKSIVFLTHSHATKEMVDAARKVLENHGFRNIVETTAGATITSHCGPKTLGILFYNDGNLR